jgi:hypothetical protein
MSLNSEDKILLFLYREIGLKWEKVLSKNENRKILSLRSNKKLEKLIKDENIIYNLTNSKNINVSKKLESNTFYMTETGSTRIGSLVKHLRNSIMHGHYETLIKDKEIIFKDFYRKRVTMYSKNKLQSLEELMSVLQ